MAIGGRAVVTGAFSNTGAAVVAELGRRGWAVETLTNRMAPAGSRIKATPLQFERDHLIAALRGADVLVSTYWVRLAYGGQTFDTAVDRGKMLLEAAVAAGVRRVVQVSVANAAAGAHLAYFAGKTRLEEYVRGCGAPQWAIVRPTLVVGPGDVLTNNIAWFLRHAPMFLVPGGGACRLQPVTLADNARIIADSAEADGNMECDAAGPEVFTFREFLEVLCRACRCRPWLVTAPAWMALAALKPAGLLLRDIVLNREELQCLLDELMLSRTAPLGRESVTEWLMAHGAEIGVRYENDLDRHFRGRRAEPLLDPRSLQTTRP